MNARELRGVISIVAAVVLLIAGITTAAVLGSTAGVVAAVLLGTLILSYAVRHEARSAYVYHRRG
jgi:hypothetical protein